MASEPESEGESAASEPALGRGTYEVLRERLIAQARELSGRAQRLNDARLEIFGGRETAVVGSEILRTENNCVPRDIIAVGRFLLFGYNVFIGLKTETEVSDVLSLHRFESKEDGSVEVESVADDDPANFLANPKFVADFRDLYAYYKDTKLLQLRQIEGRFLAVFQTGRSARDLKVFRWALDPEGAVTYIDDRGERDHVFPPSHDFEWTAVRREDFVQGRHPHVSILDEVFVETMGGTLTVKVENNTESGEGVYSEPVDDPDQSLDDAITHFAKVGTLILLRIQPYGEQASRHLVFNTRTHDVRRIDAIGHTCLQLPEDHGLIFPGGFYLQGGQTKTFEGDVTDMEFMRAVRSPNGEDVLYVFHERSEGRSILLVYNLIRKEVANPIHCHGYSLFADGRLVVFRAASDEPTRVHTMQVWQTPFVSDELAAAAPSSGTYLEKIGNADLVRAISDSLSIRRLVEDAAPSIAIFSDLVAATVRMSDAYHWLANAEAQNLREPLDEIRHTGEQVLGEFEKVQEARERTRQATEKAEAELEALLEGIAVGGGDDVQTHVEGLAALRRHRGEVMALREMRYVEADRIDRLEARVVEEAEKRGRSAVDFLIRDDALLPFRKRIDALAEHSEAIEKVVEGEALREEAEAIGDGLELLTDVVASLPIDDATVRTGILERISEELGNLNRARALLDARHGEIREGELGAAFGAEFALFGQSVTGALALADTPEAADEQLSKLLLHLEGLEGRFGEIDRFLEQLSTKREDVYEAFSSRKQSLLDARQRRAGRMMQAAERILEGVQRRTAGISDDGELNAYFAGDPMVAKLRDLARELRELGDSVKADELDSRLKSARQNAQRGMRDRQDLFEDGADVIKLGRHRFSVSTQKFALTMVPQETSSGLRMALHLTGTDFHEVIEDEALNAARPYWDQLIVSETEDVYRGEYLAASILFDAIEGSDGLGAILSGDVPAESKLLERARSYAAERYEEGYERGIHDADAAKILARLLEQYRAAGLLRFTPRSRSAACLFWAFFGDTERRSRWERRARSLTRLRADFAHHPTITAFAEELATAIGDFGASIGIELHADDRRAAGHYLFEELGRLPQRFVASPEALRLRDALLNHLRKGNAEQELASDFRELEGDLASRHQLAHAWVTGFLDHSADEAIASLRPEADEAAALLLTEGHISQEPGEAQSAVRVDGLLGQHPRIEGRALAFRLDELLSRLSDFRQTRVPGFRAFQELRHELLERETHRLRLGEFEPKVMSAFVRNRLIDQVYLPLIGDNLAKQMGSVGEGKRTDQMGLLMLVSPPGYGKTTLMEYVANRLGLVFVKVNGPALGHEVTSIDPDDAPNATARQEVEKINFALEMGNNVLLYLDDIQHTHPELLQKFISLCDAQRRIEGSWKGRTRTYDLRGKRFAICMAGNPYTESGEKFRIPDMLANRADTYNLGDILEGRLEPFELSYIENSLTSNEVLAPLAARVQDDVELLVRMARGEDIPPDQLEHDYAATELQETLAVLKKLLRVQQVLLAVNQQYIESAAQADAFRTEPRFQLQGSYRNMNRLAEKIVPVMNDAELEALIDDHYAGESQTLTTGAEHNLLKLAELRGTMDDEQRARWAAIKKGFARLQAMGGGDDDPVARVIGQLGLVTDGLEGIGREIASASSAAASRPDGSVEQAKRLEEALVPRLAELEESLVPRLAEIEKSLVPQLREMETRLSELVRASAEEAAGDGIPEDVHALLMKMFETVGESLIPLVSVIGRRLRMYDSGSPQELEGLVDRHASNIEKLNDLIRTLRDLPTSRVKG